MSPQDPGQIRHEGSDALGIEVVGDFPAGLRGRPEARSMPLGAEDSLAGRPPTPPIQHCDGVLAPVPGGQA